MPPPLTLPSLSPSLDPLHSQIWRVCLKFCLHWDHWVSLLGFWHSASEQAHLELSFPFPFRLILLHLRLFLLPPSRAVLLPVHRSSSPKPLTCYGHQRCFQVWTRVDRASRTIAVCTMSLPNWSRVLALSIPATHHQSMGQKLQKAYWGGGSPISCPWGSYTCRVLFPNFSQLWVNIP